MKGCFNKSPRDWPSSRANTSVPPPGDEGTMSLTGLAGHASSARDANETSAATIATGRVRVIFMWIEYFVVYGVSYGSPLTDHTQP